MRKALRYLVVIALVFSMTIPSKAAEVVSESMEENRLNEIWKEKEDYPITPQMEEFKNYSLSELQEILNPPQEVLETLSNEKLAALMLDYPLLINLFAFEKPEQAMQALERSSSVFAEVLSRKDMVSFLLREYKNREIEAKCYEERIEREKAEEIATMIFMEDFFSVYKNIVSEEEQNEYVNYRERWIEADIESYSTIKNIDLEPQESNKVLSGFLTYGFNGNGTYCTNGYILPFPYNMTHYSNYEYGIYYLYTLSAPCLKFISNDYSNTVKNFLNTLYNDYSGFYWLSDATTKYNCHSYAWLLRDPSNNEYWLNNPESIYNGYSLVNVNGSAQYGDRIVIFDSSDTPIHSAYVTTGNYYLGSIRVESKLGTQGLYNTSLADLMAFYQGTRYRVYR